MIPDPAERTVKIPAEWRDGKWHLLGGGELPQLKDGAIVDLVFPAIYLADLEDVKRWTQEITVSFLPVAREIFIRVNQERVPSALLDKTVEKPDSTGLPRRFVKVVLEDDLNITFVQGKKGTLNVCRCVIPAIEEAAESVSEAYRKIATQFEPYRRSTSGNIFLLAFTEREGSLVMLDRIRDEKRQLSVEAKQGAVNRRHRQRRDVGNQPHLPGL